MDSEAHQAEETRQGSRRRSRVLTKLDIAFGACLAASVLAPGDAKAGSRLSQCGGSGQRACTIAEIAPSCDPFLFENLESCGFLCVEAICRPLSCGGLDQPFCVPFVDHPYSNLCKAGLYSDGERCRGLDADGYPPSCGDDGEPACSLDLQTQLGITSCKPGLVEQAGLPVGTCRSIDAEGYPTFCGDADEPACPADLQLQLAITSCKSGLFEEGAPGGTCRPLDAELYPIFCGDEGEPACSLDLQTQLGIASCKPGLVEEPGIPVGTCRLANIPEPGLGTDVVVEPSPPGEPVFGLADLHSHVFAAEGFGGLLFWGKPFHRYGVAGALDWCTRGHGPGGTLEPIGNFQDDTLLGHPVGGYPEFDGWPRWDSSNHQQMYYRWLERAYRGGLRLLVVHAVTNEVLCNVAKRAPGYTCDDMDAADRQLQAARDLEAYIDAREGGAGRGWFRIVESAAQARRVVESGKLAVVLGIEVDSLFGCSERAQRLGACDAEQVRAELERYHALGVRHLFPVHVFDNAFGGSALYNPLFTLGNLAINGKFLAASDCASLGHEGLVYDANVVPDGLPSLLGTPSPSYPPANGHCNPRSLTPLGESLLRDMMRLEMIIDVDHMSAETLEATLALAEAERYPVVAGHTGFVEISRGQNRSEAQKSREQVHRIRDLGGLVAPIFHQGGTERTGAWRSVPNNCDESSKSWAQAYLYAVDQMRGGPFLHAVPIGSDLNGFIHQPAPRFGAKACAGNSDQASLQANPVDYPFPAHDGSGSFHRLETGERTFDINTDGLANVGLLPDFIQELKNVGVSDEDLAPLFRSAEAYIQMWERIESDEVLDQEYVAAGPGGLEIDEQQLAQTFTVGRAGRLTRIELQIGALFSPSDALVVDIREVAAGTIPSDDSAALFSTTLAATELPTGQPFPFTEIVLTGAAIEVSPGDVLAITARGTNPPGLGNFAWTRDVNGGYESGAGFVRTSSSDPWVGPLSTDLGFRTFVPEPNGSFAFLIALAPLWIVSRARRAAPRRRKVRS